MVIQILITFASIGIIIKGCYAYRHHVVGLATFLGWSLFWVVVLVVLWQPALTDRLASLLQVGRGADAIFYLSLIAIFYLLFRVFVVLERIRREITELTRAIAHIERDHSNDSR